MTETFREQQSRLPSLDIYLFIKMSEKKEHPDVYVRVLKSKNRQLLNLISSE